MSTECQALNQSMRPHHQQRDNAELSESEQSCNSQTVSPVNRALVNIITASLQFGNVSSILSNIAVASTPPSAYTTHSRLVSISHIDDMQISHSDKHPTLQDFSSIPSFFQPQIPRRLCNPATFKFIQQLIVNK